MSTTMQVDESSVGRYYDPATGQFLSVDPLVDVTRQPYAYTGDNPVNEADPTGTITCPTWVPGCGVATNIQNGLSGPGWNAIKSFLTGLVGNPGNCNTNQAAYNTGNVAWWTAAIGGLIGGGLQTGDNLPNAGETQGAEASGDLATIVGPDGVELPGVPAGAAGVDIGTGVQYSIPEGTPGLDPRVVSVRVMDPVTTGKYQYPNGYVVYMNASGQTVNPLTGRTISNADPLAHIPLP